jgi:DNA recombination protein RmuC
MNGADILLILILLLLIITAYFSYKAALPKYSTDAADLRFKLSQLAENLERIETAVKHEMALNRGESGKTAKDARDEMTLSLRSFGDLISKSMNTSGDLQKSQLGTFSDNLNKLTVSIDQKIDMLNTRSSLKMDQMRDTLEKKISELQTGNEKKLDEMRATVDEKLQKTLETRLGESFKLVSERLEAVHKGLGDMQQLATGVGDLKKVLTNVKSRGVLGEYQLQNLLEQLFTPDQYARNVKTKSGSQALVEFALKLPGREDQTLWLPIDSKFPKEDFELLMNAYDNGNTEMIEECRKNFVRGIKKCALDISSKYIDPPNTTDFAILFLPFESLYAEVLRTPGLFETIQKECKINIAGPTTLSAFLSSLQMGFRTLAIEKRSSEVWELLGAVKSEFGLFGSILEKTQKKLQEASNVMDSARQRSRVIERKLKSVQELPVQQKLLLLDEVTENDPQTPA